MKARVIETGNIINVTLTKFQLDSNREIERYMDDETKELYVEEELDFSSENEEPSYWEKLKHQYAGMVMQGLLSNPTCENLITKAIVQEAVDIATALVEKLKNE